MSIESRLKDVEEALRLLRDANRIQGRRISGTKPTDKQVYMWNETARVLEPVTGAQTLSVRATSSLTLTTSAQSIVGDGDSTKVRILLPTIGEWVIIGTFDFAVTATDPDAIIGECFLDDSVETGRAIFQPGQPDRATVSQVWIVTTTVADTPVELKAKKETDAGTAIAVTPHTTLVAAIGIGGGSVAAASDHGNLTGLGDPSDHAWALLADGSRAGSTSQAQDFGSNGIKADVIAESTPAAGVTADGVLLKDSAIHVGGSAAPLLKSLGSLVLLRLFDDSGYTFLVADQVGLVSAASSATHAIRKAEFDTHEGAASIHHTKYLDTEAVTAVPYRFYLSFGSDPLFGDTFAP